MTQVASDLGRKVYLRRNPFAERVSRGHLGRGAADYVRLFDNSVPGARENAEGYFRWLDHRRRSQILAHGMAELIEQIELARSSKAVRTLFEE